MVYLIALVMADNRLHTLECFSGLFIQVSDCKLYIYIYFMAASSLLEKEMATYSSILVWKIPWIEEPGRLQSMVSQRVRQDWVHIHGKSLFPCTGSVAVQGLSCPEACVILVPWLGMKPMSVPCIARQTQVLEQQGSPLDCKLLNCRSLPKINIYSNIPLAVLMT